MCLSIYLSIYLLKRSEKFVDESLTLVLIFHPALNCVHKILTIAHYHVLKCNRLPKLLTLPSRVAFRNAKSLI